MTFHGIPRRMCRDVVFVTQCNFPIVVLSVGFLSGAVKTSYICTQLI